MTRRVLFCGAWDEGDGYPRTTALRLSLQSQGVQVAECRAPALGQHKQRLLRQPWRWPGWLLGQWLRRRRFQREVKAAIAQHRPEVIVVPYPGHLLVAAIKRIAPVPVVLDLFLSAHDTAVADRGLFAADSLAARALLELDRRACASADLVLLDTEQNALHTAAATGLPTPHFDWLPVGDPQAPAVPAALPAPADGLLRLLFFGTGVPLHGLPFLIDAVAAVPGVLLTLVGGTGPERRHAQQRLHERLDLQPEFVPRARLRELLDRTQLVAGVFGTSAKAQRVVPFKVVHALAAGRPVITAQSPAVQAVLSEGEGAFLVPAGDATALALRLQQLHRQPQLVAAAAGRARAVYDRAFAVERTGARFVRLLRGLVASASAAGPGDDA